MKSSTRVVVLALSFSACGRLELGGYGPPLPNGGDDPTVGGQPVGPGSGAAGASAGDGGRASSAGQAPSVGGGGGTAAAGGASGSAGAAGDGAAGAGGEGGIGTGLNSCRDLSDVCGSPPRSCCSVGYVRGGEFLPSGLSDSETSPVKSHVSSFYLGEFEVTVGRFQAFLGAYDAWRATGAPEAGAGSHPSIPGSGWDPAWLRQPNDPPERDGLGVNSAEISAEVTGKSGCLGIPFSTGMWNQPINCVSFYNAAAFCLWDGGRLPTNLEWEYAAAGGDENRIYPWGSDEPTNRRAMFGCINDLQNKCIIPVVGSYAEGAGRFGQLDLAGSMEEWTFDAFGKPRPNPCNDCASVEQIYEGNPRVLRGGNWNAEPEKLRVALSAPQAARWPLPQYGFRCAYDVP